MSATFCPGCRAAAVTNCKLRRRGGAIAIAARFAVMTPKRLKSRWPNGKMQPMPACALHPLRTRHVGPTELRITAGECVCPAGSAD